ncbi:adenosine deaminase-related growth [Gymnopus androsaceus JB14]|uniref:adenosine deaminase n=1 Tax=Gymnopus androsaceus JB14 TaxID=1447944 RepID=A0A6A4H8V9_9AGAR|nr:adenosine deaminase-related growth [Gymnopus androsaceus JB14]
MSFNSIAEYEASRNALILADRALRADHKKGQLSELEALADKVVRDVRAAEAASIWSQDHEGIPHPFPGMEFLTGRSIIVQTKLFEILGKMPKGGLLHAHLDATVNVSFLLKTAMRYPAIHVRASTALNSTTIGSVLPQFLPLPQELRTSGEIALTDENYTPNTWVPLAKARETFDPKLGGPEGFDRWITASLTINPTEAYVTHNTVNKIWEKFVSTFVVNTPLVRYEPIHREYVREFILSSIADGISYVEPRINFLQKDIPFIAADAHTRIDHREVVKSFDEVVNNVKEELKEQGREDEFIGAKIIYSTIRSITPEGLEWYLQDCIALKKEFPHLIAGFDLVGPENVLKPLKYYIEPLLKFREMQKEAGVEIPFIFHAAETLGDGTEADMNLYDAILLGTKRIGHGFALVKHPKLIEICKERGIAIEVCPISNEILRLTSSMHMHPLPVLLNQGVTVALCSDDPSVFGSMGLTFDYFQVLAASEVTGLIQLGEMAKDSIKFSSMDPEEKERALAAWQKRWDIFLEYAATEGQKFLAQSQTTM